MRGDQIFHLVLEVGFIPALVEDPLAMAFENMQQALIEEGTIEDIEVVELLKEVDYTTTDTVSMNVKDDEAKQNTIHVDKVA